MNGIDCIKFGDEPPQENSPLTNAMAFLLAVILMAFVFLTSGCAAHAITEHDEPPEPTPLVDDDLRDSESAASSIPLRVSAPASIVATVHELLGDAGTLTLNGAARQIVRDDLTVTLPPATLAEFALASDGGTIAFAKPLPTVTAKLFAGIKVSPSLTKIVLNADDTATAHVRSLLGTHKRTFPLTWETDSESEGEDADGSGQAAVVDKPEVWAYATSGCAPCTAAKRELAEAKDLPFVVRWRDDRPACVTGGFPSFWWHRSESKPREEDSQNTRVKNGWPGVKGLLEIWKANRDVNRYRRDRTVSWSINGNFRPSRQVLIAHLLHDGIHCGRHDGKWLDSLTTEQLLLVHDLDHGS